jgi:hypothetical protein
MGFQWSMTAGNIFRYGSMAQDSDATRTLQLTSNTAVPDREEELLASVNQFYDLFQSPNSPGRK